MKKLLDQLAKINKDLPEKVDKIVQANGSEMAQSARRLAPIDTGALRQSIRKRRGEELGETTVTAGVRYAAYMEFGTGGLVEVPPELQDIAIRFKGSGKKRIDIRPRPFMWPSLLRQRPILQNDLEKFLRRTFNI